MKQSSEGKTSFLIAVQGLGAVFVGIFLVAYLGGMFMNPSTTVLHFEPVFRIPLIVFGAGLLGLMSIGIILAASKQRS